MTMTGYEHVAHLLAMFGLGAACSSVLWLIVLGFSPRRRRPAPLPELEPTRAVRGDLLPDRRALPPLLRGPLGPRHGRDA